MRTHRSQKHPRVLLWGDSLTEGRPGVSYPDILTAACPGLRFSNYGKGGDTVRSLLKRLQDAHSGRKQRLKAAAAVLWVGVNDVFADIHPGYGLFKTALRQPPTREAEIFTEIYGRILDILKEHAEKLLVLSPFCVGEDPGNQLNTRLREMTDMIAGLCADDASCRFIDMREVLPLKEEEPPAFLPANPWSRIVDNLGSGKVSTRAYDAAAERRGLKWTYDGVHLNSAGAEAVAAFVKGKLEDILHGQTD